MYKIMLVDDSEDSLCLLETILKKRGFEVVLARNGIEALEKLEKNNIDVIVSDILMPEMDGFEFCRECKKDDSLKRIPFVFYTATYTNQKDEEFAMSLGAETFIAKPCDNTEFTRILESIIENYRSTFPVTSKISITDEKTFLKEYNKRLVEKLEHKILGLEKEVVRRKQLEGSLEARTRQQKTIARLGHKAILSKDLTAFMGEVVGSIAGVLDNEYCKVLELLPGGKDMLLRAGIGWREGLVGHATVSAGLDSQAGYTMQSSKPVIVEDMRIEKRFSGPLFLYEHNVVSGMSVLIHGQRGPWGVLGTHTTQHISYSKDDVSFIQAVANILADVIARKQDETALREGEERYRILVSSVKDYAIFMMTPEGIINSWNEGVKQIKGYSADEIIGKHISAFYLEEDIKAGKIEHELLKAKEDGQYEDEGWRVRKDGSRFWANVVITALFDNGKLRGYTKVTRDFTDRKKAEDTLREQKKALEHKNIALNEVLGQIEIEKKQIKDNVVANAENLLLPIIQKLRLKGESSKYVQLLQNNLKELTSSFGAKLTEKRANLTTREIEICNMIKNGLTNKEIANLLNISLGTIEKHRNNIRTKLHIVNKAINLSSFLNTL